MLKFITEDYLKDLYKKAPFTKFNLKISERLTPGGRQYLLDKGIKFDNNLPTDNKDILKKEDVKEEKVGSNRDLKEKKLIYKFKALETLFLISASEMINEDIKLTQKIVDLGRHIKEIRESIEGKYELEIINPKNSNENFDAIEITDVYIYLKNSKKILNIYYLFCKVQEFKCEIILDLEGMNISDNVLEKVCEIENILFGIIEKEAGER